MNVSYKNLVLFIALILFSFGCKESNKTTTLLNGMHDEVMIIHDQVMPEMKTTNKLRKQLMKSVNDITDPAEKAKRGKAVLDLKNADEAMMVWMQDFKKPDYQEVEKAKAFYNTEMDKIQGVKSLFDKSIAQANEILLQ